MNEKILSFIRYAVIGWLTPIIVCELRQSDKPFLYKKSFGLELGSFDQPMQFFRRYPEPTLFRVATPSPPTQHSLSSPYDRYELIFSGFDRFGSATLSTYFGGSIL